MLRSVARGLSGIQNRTVRVAAIGAVCLLSVGCTDLVIESLSVAPPAPTTDDAIAVTTVVQNRGMVFGGGAGSSTLQVRITQAGATVSVDNRNVPGLRGGESHTEVIGTRLEQPGTYMITAIADAFDSVGEGQRENNNDAQLLLTVRPGIADLVIEALTPVASNPRTMETLEVVATIGNQGAAVVTPFRLRAELERNGDVRNANPQIAGIGGGENIDVELAFSNITEAGSYELTATVDHDNDIVGEADETNNTATAVIVVAASHYWDASVTAGAAHSCGDGFCWGRNGNGQLGDGSTTDSNVPVPVAVAQEMAAVSAGDAHTCGKLGNAWRCWGANQRGQLGNGTTADSATPVAPSFGVNRLSAGAEHTCGISSSNEAMGGTVYCWGANQRGQLGNGTTTDSNVPVAVAGDLSFIAVSAGGEHTCGITTSGHGKCWGANDAGQLGNGTTTDSAVPVDVSAWSSFRFISAGAAHSCGTFLEGDAKCWGSNRFGQLGLGSFDTAPHPTPAPLFGWTTNFWHAQPAISAGADHTCAIHRGEITAVRLKLLCWGGNAFGQLGVATNETCTGGTPCTTRPQLVVDAGRVFSVGAGGFHTCAIGAYRNAGRIAKCWGQNEDGALGNGGAGDSPTPIRVAEPP